MTRSNGISRPPSTPPKTPAPMRPAPTHTVRINQPGATPPTPRTGTRPAGEATYVDANPEDMSFDGSPGILPIWSSSGDQVIGYVRSGRG